jgi:tetratricopeptide (TPR) repeat protein
VRRDSFREVARREQSRATLGSASALGREEMGMVAHDRSFWHRLAALALCLCCFPLRADADAPLGHIDFPVTGSAEARRHFLRGVLALHSFWYEEARDEFRAATAIAPDFAMGYWGEALTFYHPIWSDEKVAATRAALDKIPRNANVTARERDFIAAARELAGTGEQPQRWAAYADAMRRVHRAYPADDEAATFYAVALLGASPRTGSFRPYAEAGAIGLAVLARNPNHPGAAHYVIHAFDDADHAILALPAALRYAMIAPEAFHARHMPSHIFVQLGMWKEAQASNESSWAASVAAAKKKQLDTSYEDFHSLLWLERISLERGQPHHAREVLQRGFDALAQSQDPDLMPWLLGNMAADYVSSTGDWEHMDALLAPLATVEHSVLTSKSRMASADCAQHAKTKAADAALDVSLLLATMRAEAALARKDRPAVAAALAETEAIATKMKDHPQDEDPASLLVLRARAAELDGKPEQAIVLFRQGIARETAPASGPAGAVTPRELLGELFARLGRQQEALAEFSRSLDRHPGRSRALLGAARAACALGDPRASEYAAQLARNWAEAEPAQPGLDLATCKAVR